MKYLQDHYYGTSEGAQRKKFARNNLKKIFYKNETPFKFEKFVANLKGMFNVLEEYGVPLYEEKMVEHLLDQIIQQNTDLNTDVNICRSSHSSKFFKASTQLSMVVDII